MPLTAPVVKLSVVRYVSQLLLIVIYLLSFDSQGMKALIISGRGVAYRCSRATFQPQFSSSSSSVSSSIPSSASVSNVEWRRQSPLYMSMKKRPVEATANGRTGRTKRATAAASVDVAASPSTSSSSSIFTRSSLEVNTSDRPFTLPPGEFRPKQSLGQNYLSDQNYVMKIVNTFDSDDIVGDRVVEIGPGLGALTRVLTRKYPTMTAVEIDQRAVAFLKEKLPELSVIHADVLDFDWPQWAASKGGRLSIIANLPYYITSQVLFALADAHRAIDKAVVTLQLEVAERITAAPGSKQYGIPSVVFQLYGKTRMNFKIPPKVFFPVPKVDSGLITIDFTQPHPQLHRVDPDQLRKVITHAFRQRRKMLRQSLKAIVNQDELELPDKWAVLRPEQLRPEDFLQLTLLLYGERSVVQPLTTHQSVDVVVATASTAAVDDTDAAVDDNSTSATAAVDDTDALAAFTSNSISTVPIEVVEEQKSSSGNVATRTSLLGRLRNRASQKAETNAVAVAVAVKAAKTVTSVAAVVHPDRELYSSNTVWRKTLGGKADT